MRMTCREQATGAVALGRDGGCEDRIMDGHRIDHRS